MKVLHLTHTDIRTDSRILKELSALEATGLYELYGVGMAEHGTRGELKALHSAKVTSINLFFRSLRWLPGLVRHAMVYVEMLLRAFIQGLAVNPRLIHCHDVLLLPVAVTVAWVCRAKLMYDAHELESDKNGQTRLNARCTIAVEKWCMRRVSGFVTVSPSILSWYGKHFEIKESALVYNSPVFSRNPITQLSSFGERYFHRKYDIPEDRLVFVYLGLLMPGRGIETLLNVFSMPDVSAHVVFIGRGSLQDSITSQALMNDRIHLHDVVPHNQVVPLVRCADYGFCMVEKVSLSDYYSLPNKLFEYAFAKVPVLASNFPDMRQLIEQFGLGMCADNDLNSITKAVVRLQGEQRRRITSDIEVLDWHAQAEKLTALYAKLLPPAS